MIFELFGFLEVGIAFEELLHAAFPEHHHVLLYHVVHLLVLYCGLVTDLVGIVPRVLLKWRLHALAVQ